MTLILLVSSCNRKSDYPNVNFIGGRDLVSESTTLKPNQIFKVGINSYSLSDYNIWKFKVIRYHDNYSETLIDSLIDNKNFNTIMSLPSSGKEDKERWVFSLTCYDGYTSEISLSIKTSDSIVDNNDKSLSKEFVMDDLPYQAKNDTTIYIGAFILLMAMILVYFMQRKKKIVKEYVKIEAVKDFKDEVMKKISEINSFSSSDIMKTIEENNNNILNKIDLKKKEETEKISPFKKTNVILILSILGFLVYVVTILASVLAF